MIYQITTKIFSFVTISYLLTASLLSLFASEEQASYLVEKIQEELPGIRVIREDKVSITQNSIGSGAFGNVYGGKWREDTENTKETLVFKEINRDQARTNLYDQGNSVTLENIDEIIVWEAIRSASLNHPNVMEFEGVCQKNGKFYLVSKFYNQGNLQKYLQNNNEIPQQQLIKWMLDITHGLMYLHQQGILHRDLKADNIFIDGLNRARLGDFGVVQIDDRLIDTTSPVIVTMGIQSRRFKAPESVIEWSYSSKETDIYALGLVFWQLIHNGNSPRYTWEWMKDILQTNAEYMNKNKINGQQEYSIAPLREISSEAREKIKNLFIQSRELPERESILTDCSESLKQLICQCWSNNPQSRPSLQYIEENLYSLLNEASIAKACTKIKRSLHGKLHGDYVIPIEASLLGQAGDQRKTITEIFKDFLAEEYQQIMILLGNAGSGKTHSTYKLCDEMIDEWEQYLEKPLEVQKPAYFPILLRQSCSQWSAKNLKGSLKKSLDHYGVDKNLLSIIGTKPLFIIDGYDECIIDVDNDSTMYEDNLDSIDKHLKDAPDFIGLNKFSGSKLIVTNRLVENRKLRKLESQWKAPHSYRIENLADSVIQQYIEMRKRYWSSDIDEKCEEAIKKFAPIQDNPLLLTIFIEHIEKLSTTNTLSGEIPRKQLYEWIMRDSFVQYQRGLQQLFRSQLQNKEFEEFESFAVEVAISTFQGKSLEQQQFWAAQEEVEEASENIYESRTSTNRSILTETDFKVLKLLQFHNLIKRLPLQKRENGEYEFVHASFFEYFVGKSYEGNTSLDEKFQGNPWRCFEYLKIEKELQRTIKLFSVYIDRYWNMEPLHRTKNFQRQNFISAGGTEQEYLAMIPSDPDVKSVIEEELDTPHPWYIFHNLIKNCLSCPRQSSTIDGTPLESSLNFIIEDYKANHLEYKKRFKSNYLEGFEFLSKKYNEQYLNTKFPTSEHEPINRTEIFLLDKNIQYGWMWADIYVRKYTITSGEALRFDGRYHIKCCEADNSENTIMRKLEINHVFKKVGRVQDLHGPLLRNTLKFLSLYDF